MALVIQANRQYLKAKEHYRGDNYGSTDFETLAD